MGEMLPVTFADFGEGLNTEMPVMKLTPSEAAVAYNLRSVGGVLMPRKEVAIYDKITGETSVIHSLRIFTTSADEKYMLAGCGDKIWGRKIANAPWWNAAWLYRIPITITNLSDITETNYIGQIILPASTAYGLFKTNGGDVRALDGLKELDYRIEYWKAPVTSESSIAVKFSIGPKSTKTIYLYFGNPGVETSGAQSLGEFYHFYRDLTQALGSGDFVQKGWDGRWDLHADGLYAHIWDHDGELRGYFPRAVRPPCSIKIKLTAPYWYSAYPEHTSGGICLYDEQSYFGLVLTIARYYDGSSFPTTSYVEGNWYYMEVFIGSDFLVTNKVFGADNKLLVAGSYQSNGSAVNDRRPGIRAYGKLCNVTFSEITVNRYNKDIRYALGGEETKAGSSAWVLLHTLASDAAWSTAEIVDTTQKKKIIFANGGYCVTWNGGTAVDSWKTWSSITGLRHPVKYIAAHKGRLFGAYDTDGKKSRLFYCNVTARGEASIEGEHDWQTTISAAWVDNYEDIGNGSPITGLIPAMFDSLLITTEKNILLLYGDSPANWGEKPLAYPYGCVAPRSIVKHLDTVFFCSAIGIHYIAGEMGHAEAFTFDNIKADSLSEKIKSLVPTFERSNAFGAVWDNKYYLFFPSSNQSAAHPSICLILDWRRKSWWLDSELDYGTVFSPNGQGAPPLPISTDKLMSAVVDDETNAFFVGGGVGGDNCVEIGYYDTLDPTWTNKSDGRWKSGVLQIMPTWEMRVRELRVTLQGDVKVWVKTDKMFKDFSIQTHIKNMPDSIVCKRIACSIDGEFFELGIENITNKVIGVDMSAIPLRRK